MRHGSGYAGCRMITYDRGADRLPNRAYWWRGTGSADPPDVAVDLRVTGAAASPWLVSSSYLPIRRAAEG
jgi:hypothetical protein